MRAYKKFTEEYQDYEINVKLCAYTSNEMAKAKKEFNTKMGGIESRRFVTPMGMDSLSPALK